MTQGPLSFDRFDEARARYGVEIRQIPSGVVLVIVNELPEHRGAAVAGLYDHLATELYRNYFQGLPVWSLVWLLRHPSRETAAGPSGAAYDQVVLEWDGHHFRSPRRIPLPRESWETYGLAEG